MPGLLGNLDELVAQVRRRAEQRALVIEHRGEAEATALLESARERSRAEAARIAEASTLAAAQAQREHQAGAGTARRRRELEAREAWLERVWSMAARELADVRLDHATLAVLARDAAATLGGAEVRLRFDPASAAGLDAATVAAWATPDGPTLVLDPEPLGRGRGLEARSGRSAIDATLETRLEHARERLRGEVAAILAGTAEPDA